MTDKKKESILRKVRGLLDKANSTEFSAERDSFIAKADELMATYAIEAFEIEFAKSADERRKPELREFEYRVADRDIRDAITRLFYALAGHARCKIGYYGWASSKVVGYVQDLDYLDLLFTNISLHLSANLEPKNEAGLSEFENVLAMKEAGIDWPRVYKLMDWDREEAPKRYKKWKNQYKKFCVENNIDGRTFGHANNYRYNFIQGYVSRINTRLAEMNRHNKQATSGKEMVLANMEESLSEALWEHFPELRPHPDTCECDGCHLMRCQDGKCKRSICVSGRKPVRYRRTASVGGPRVDYAARSAGSNVANTADLSSGRNSVANNRKEVV